MQQQNLMSAIQAGMKVEDADGDSVGTVDELVIPPRRPQQEIPAPDQTYVKVKVGLMALGGHWYIPLSVVRTVVDDRVILDVDQTRLEDLGFDQRPTE